MCKSDVKVVLGVDNKSLCFRIEEPSSLLLYVCTEAFCYCFSGLYPTNGLNVNGKFEFEALLNLQGPVTQMYTRYHTSPKVLAPNALSIKETTLYE